MIATNPYVRTQQQRLEQQRLHQRLGDQCSGKENFSEAANMVGLQSQWRGGSIKNCRKRAVQLKIRSNCRKIAEEHKKNKHFLQQAMDGGIAFVPHLHCRICVALQKQKMASCAGAKVSIPHRAHHPSCPQNKKTQGRSERHVEVERYAKKMIERNNLPLAKGQLEGITSVKQHFSVNSNDGTVRCHTNTQFNMEKEVPAGKDQINIEKGVPAGNDQFFDCLEVESEATFQDFNATPVASYLRKKLDELLKTPEAVAKAEKTNAPLAVALMVGHITRQIHHLKNSAAELPSSDTFLEAYARYRKFFSLGQIRFSFPKERQDLVPSPLYHSLEGSEYIHVDWLLSHPKTKLLCFECMQNKNEIVELAHDRTTFSHSAHLFPIFGQDGKTAWANVMKYCCSRCATRYYGNDGRLLQMLPPNVAMAYPVLPRFAVPGATFHLNVECAEDFADIMLIYANGDFFSRRLYDRKLREYERRLISFFSIKTEEKHSEYVSMKEWIGEIPPSGDTLRLLYQQAERSKLNYTGVSNVDRYSREISSVGCNDLSAIDWTHAVTKNYNIPGAKACFTMNTETSEIAALGLVETTGVDQAAHMIEQVSRRPNFRPKAIVTDTWPANEHFWYMIFGPIVGCLGIFHFMKRIVDTLNPRNSKYWEALVALKEAIYSYHQLDYSELIRVMKTGLMRPDGKKLNERDIHDLQRSKRWKQRYGAYLRKMLHKPEIIQTKLMSWWLNYCAINEDGKWLCNKATEPAILNQMRHTQDIQFPDGVEMYREIKPGRRSKHGLSKWISSNPEPALESWHGRFANFGNTGMAAGLSDCLHLKGTAEGNVKIRHLLAIQEDEMMNEWLPSHHRETPALKDHLLGSFINELAVKAGCAKIPFPKPWPLRPPNGEKFLSEYFYAQKARNESPEDKPDGMTKRCGCIECERNITPLMSTVEENAIPNGISVPDEVVHRAIEVGPQSRRELTLTITRASCTVIGNQPGRIVPVIPIAPSRPLPALLPQYPPISTHIYDNNSVCCLEFLKYLDKAKSKGRLPPGPKPHHSSCPRKLARKSASDKAQNK